MNLSILCANADDMKIVAAACASVIVMRKQSLTTEISDSSIEWKLPTDIVNSDREHKVESIKSIVHSLKTMLDYLIKSMFAFNVIGDWFAGRRVNDNQ
jgi:hypothetical protein